MNRRAFTLLEVMLALALVSLVLVAVAMAIDVHLRMLDSGRTNVMEAQLARGLLRRIADDLRGAVLYDPMDVESLVPAMPMPGGDLAEGAAGSLGSMGAGAADSMSAGAGLDSSEFDEGGETGNTSELAESTVPPSTPGVYGNRNELMIDTSRLPRIDQYDAMASADGSVTADRVSEVKTVTYFVIGNTSGGLTSGTGYGSSYGTAGARGGSQYRTGLVRRELDRATTAWASENGTLSDMLMDVEPIAPEVAAIEFRYFDGTEWLDEWDSEERSGLPVAVEIVIAIVPSRGRDAESSVLRTSGGLASDRDSEWMIYRLLVHLPVAQPTTGEETSETSEDSADATDSGAGGASSPEGGSGR